jgi:DNA repair ATPase RecN
MTLQVATDLLSLLQEAMKALEERPKIREALQAAEERLAKVQDALVALEERPKLLEKAASLEVAEKRVDALQQKIQGLEDEVNANACYQELIEDLSDALGVPFSELDMLTYSTDSAHHIKKLVGALRHPPRTFWDLIG